MVKNLIFACKRNKDIYNHHISKMFPSLQISGGDYFSRQVNLYFIIIFLMIILSKMSKAVIAFVLRSH